MSMEPRKDTPLVEAEAAITRILREEHGELLAAAKEAVKKKVLLATVQQAFEELGSPEVIAQQAFASLGGGHETLRRAGEVLHQQLLAEVTRRATEALADPEEAAAQAIGRLDREGKLFRSAHHALQERLLAEVARRATEALAEVEEAAAQASERVDPGSEVLRRVTGAVKERLLKQVLHQAVVEINDEVALPDEDRAAPSHAEAMQDEAEQERGEAAAGAAVRYRMESLLESEPGREAGGDGISDGHVTGAPASVAAEAGPAGVAVETDQTEGYYIYGILDAREALPEDALPASGLDPDHAPYLVAYKGLQAIVSKISLLEFSEKALPHNLKDAAWKRRYKSKHIELLEQVAATGCALVPRPFATLRREEHGVQEMLAEHYDYFLNALERLRGKQEWSVKVYGDLERLQQVVQGKTRKMEGFLGELPDVFAIRIKQEMAASLLEEIEVISESCAKYSHNMLLSVADEGRLHALRPPGGASDMLVMAAVYLVSADQEQNFAAMLERLSAKHGEVGFSYDRNGPRPPLSFCE